MGQTTYPVIRRLYFIIHIMSAAAAANLVCTKAPAAEIQYSPFITASEVYTDNVYETATATRSDFITRIQPGITSRYQAPFWNWDLAYNFDYRQYARNSRSAEYTHNGTLRGSLSLLDNFFFVDLSDTYRRVTVDVVRNIDTESSLFLNQTDQNTALISPYLLWRLDDKDTLRTGYRYREVRYNGPGVETFEHGAFAELNHVVSSRFSVSAGYDFTYLDSLPTSYTKDDVSVGLRYEYADRSFVFGRLGNSWHHFDSQESANYLFWNAGATHDFGFAVATLETRVQTAADPLSATTKETSYSGRLEKTLQRGMIGLSSSYTEYEDLRSVLADRHRLSISINGRYELLQSLTASVATTGERFNRTSASGYPYRVTAVAGLNYAFKDALVIGLMYTFVNNLREPNAAAAAYQVNNVMIELRKTF